MGTTAPSSLAGALGLGAQILALGIFFLWGPSFFFFNGAVFKNSISTRLAPPGPRF